MIGDLQVPPLDRGSPEPRVRNGIILGAGLEDEKASVSPDSQMSEVFVTTEGVFQRRLMRPCGGELSHMIIMANLPDVCLRF